MNGEDRDRRAAPLEAGEVVSADAVEIECAGGRYRMRLPHRDTDYIQSRLSRQRRPYEPEMLEDMRARLRPDDLVIDVGANVGNHTMYLASIAMARVVAFEPNAALSQALSESVALNQLDARVEVVRAAVGREKTLGRLIEDQRGNLGAQRMSVGAGDIEVVRLDDISLDRPARMIKIDVEGMELDVLQGAEELVRRDRPLIYVECQNEPSFRAVSCWMQEAGYRMADSFNATPTHLFMPREMLSDSQQMEQLHRRVVAESYRSARYFLLLKHRLDDAAKRPSGGEAASMDAAGLMHQLADLRARIDTLVAELGCREDSRPGAAAAPRGAKMPPADDA